MPKLKLNMRLVTRKEALEAGKKSKKAALRSSEKKWESVVVNEVLDGDGKLFDAASSNCALCHRYQLKYTIELGCGNCPLNFRSPGRGQFKDTCDLGCAFNQYSTWDKNPTSKTALAVLNRIRRESGKPNLSMPSIKKFVRELPLNV